MDTDNKNEEITSTETTTTPEPTQMDEQPPLDNTTNNDIVTDVNTQEQTNLDNETNNNLAETTSLSSTVSSSSSTKPEKPTTLSTTNQASPQPSKKSPISQPNCILFYGVTYLGCASVNAPKSEAEINRIMHTLNEQGKVCIEVTMSVPQNVDDKIVLYDSAAYSNNSSNPNEKIDVNAHIIAEYKMAHVLFVVRGGKTTTESNCFAFTTCHGDSMENLMFSCHVFRCNLVEAVSKILYSFWMVFNRQSQIQQQKQQEQQQNQTLKSRSSESASSVASTAGQLSSVASSLLGSLYVIGSNANLGGVSNSNTNNLSYLCDLAARFVNGRIEDQYVFRAIVEIKEEDPKNPSSFVTVPKEKEYFKLRKNLNKQINIQIQQLTNQPLEIERCFGLLMCQGRNVSHKDMQLLNTISMGKSGSDTSNMSSSSSSNGYLVSALWNPLDISVSSSLQVLNEETQKNTRVFMTIAVDLVLNGLQDPVRFCIETKARIYSQNEKFWVYQKNKHTEDFFLQIVKNTANSNESTTPQTPHSNYIYSLHSIHSQTELLRKQHAIDHQKQIDQSKQPDGMSSSSSNNNPNVSDDESDLVMSGLGTVSKDCAEEELLDWSDLLLRWRKGSWSDRPKGLQNLVRKGIPEALRGEVWALLAGCNEDEKFMIEKYRLLLSKDSPSENVILRDVNRTFPGHQFFQDESGQQSLYKLCKAYSIHDEEVGYCQGLSFLIASLLLHMPEEQAFNLLVKIMYKYEIREIYKTNFECLHLRFYQLENLMREFLPELYEHFIDLNIEPHMYASQWFLTLFTAKFPLYMVFRILDLFLYEGFLAIFSTALSLLKASQRDLLALDFEGVLKYFRVNLPKKYRSEQCFNQTMQIWLNIHPKLTEKKLKKYEKNYNSMKEAEALKEDPLIRYEKEVKRLTTLLRRLEQENDDLANEYIDSKMALSKQLEEVRDDYELVKNELMRYKTDYQNKLNESYDTNKKLVNELDQLKKLWRKESDKYDGELERNNIILAEYKQICNTLSGKVEKWTSFRKKYEARAKKLDLCESCVENNKIDDEPNNDSLTTSNSNNDLNNQSSMTSSSSSYSHEDTETGDPFSANTEKSNKDPNESGLSNENGLSAKEQQSLGKIKNLELELARVKLELVDAQCKNQELDHKLKGFLTNSNGQTNSNDTNNLRSNSVSSQNQTDGLSTMSASTTSLNSNSTTSTGSKHKSHNSMSMSSSVTGASSSTLNGSVTSINTNNSNNWLSKTFTQFKEATNQVVQKAQKARNDLN